MAQVFRYLDNFSKLSMLFLFIFYNSYNNELFMKKSQDLLTNQR